MENNTDMEVVGNEEDIIKEINAKAEETAPIREQIIETWNPMMRSAKKDFVKIVGCATKGVNVLKKVDKAELPELKKRLANEYAKVKDYLCERSEDDEKKGKLEQAVENIAIAVKWMDYLGEGRLLKGLLSSYGIDVVVTTPSELNTFTPLVSDAEETQKEIGNIFSEVANLHGKIKEAEDSIKVDRFEELSEDARFSKENKKGIKASQFDAIVTLRALRNIEEGKAEEKAEAAANKAMENIESNRMMYNIVSSDR